MHVGLHRKVFPALLVGLAVSAPVRFDHDPSDTGELKHPLVAMTCGMCYYGCAEGESLGHWFGAFGGAWGEVHECWGGITCAPHECDCVGGCGNTDDDNDHAMVSENGGHGHGHGGIPGMLLDQITAGSASALAQVMAQHRSSVYLNRHRRALQVVALCNEDVVVAHIPLSESQLAVAE
jgi:hypothetical protein